MPVCASLCIRRSLFLEFTSPRAYDPGFRFFVNQKEGEGEREREREREREIGPMRGSETRAHDILHHTALVNTR